MPRSVMGVGRLETLRTQVVDSGLIPRREGKDGLPTEVYYLKVKELADLVEHPEKAAEYIEMAKVRSKKRRRKKYLKTKAMDTLFATPGGHTARLREVFPEGVHVQCLGKFSRTERFMSETGFERAISGFVYLVGGRKVAISDSEAQRADLEFNIARRYAAYIEGDLAQILAAAADRIYEGVNTPGVTGEATR